MTTRTNFMSEHLGKIIVAMLVLIVALYAAWFFSTHQKVNTGTSYTPISETQEPMYAARLLLQADGKAVTHLQGQGGWQDLAQVLADTDNAAHTTILLKQVDVYNTPVKSILAWLNAGGHIITFSQDSLLVDKQQDTDSRQTYLERENPLLTELGIWTIVNRELPTGSAIELLKLPNGEYVVVGRNQYFLRYFKMDKPLPKFADYTPFATGSMAEMQAVFGLDNDSDNQVALQNYHREYHAIRNLGVDDIAILDVKVGAGRLSVLHDERIFDNPRATGAGSNEWTNNNGEYIKEHDDKTNANRYTQEMILGLEHWAYSGGIAEADNGYLLSYLTDNSTDVYLVSDVERMGLLALLWENARLMLVAIMLCVLAGVLALPRQFGRRLAYQAQQSRDVLDFFGSVGQYLWQTDNANELMSGNRRRLIERIKARYQVAAQMNNDELCQFVAGQTGLGIGLVYRALYEEYQSQQEFLAVSRAFAQVNGCFD